MLFRSRAHSGGGRLVRFDSFVLVRRLLLDETPEQVIKVNKSAVRVAFQLSGVTHYTIHIGYRLAALSKSKLHVEFFRDCGGHHVQ